MGKRCPVCPGGDSQQINGDGRDDKLQVGFGKASVSGAAQPAASDSLSMGAFDAGANGIRLAELTRLLLDSHLLQGFVMLTGLEANEAWFSL